MSRMTEPSRQRADARRDWPARVHRLGEAPAENLSDSTTAAERLGMMWQLAQDAWAMAGREIPSYPRSEMPIRIRRLGEAADEA